MYRVHYYVPIFWCACFKSVLRGLLRCVCMYEIEALLIQRRLGWLGVGRFGIYGILNELW